jgi:hypothetical protein
MLKSHVRLSTACLVTLGLFDLVTTIMLMGRGFGEGNPIFSRLLQYGPWAFVLGKVLFLAGPVLIIEFARKSHPKTAEQATWLAFCAYAFLYVMQLFRIRGMA